MLFIKLEGVVKAKYTKYNKIAKLITKAGANRKLVAMILMVLLLDQIIILLREKKIAIWNSKVVVIIVNEILLNKTNQKICDFRFTHKLSYLF